MVADADAARDAVQEIVGLRRGRVRLGATPSLCSSLVPTVLRRFRTEHPGIELHVNEGSSQDLITDLLARDLDLALIVQPGARRRPGPARRADAAREPGRRLGRHRAAADGQRAARPDRAAATPRW